jgi:hypothetical protein
MLMARTDFQTLAPLAHGGNLAAARAMFANATEPFIDLSTGINPYPYPVPEIPPDRFFRLPDEASIGRLAEIAAQSYGAPSKDHVVPAPGTQILLPQVAMLVAPGHAANTCVQPYWPDTVRTRFRTSTSLDPPTSPSSSTRTIPTAALSRRQNSWTSRASCGSAAVFSSSTRRLRMSHLPT